MINFLHIADDGMAVFVDGDGPAEKESIYVPNSVCAFPDRTGAAPTDCSWRAYDTATYDGAPDAGHQIVGYGATERDAYADYRERLSEAG